MSTWDSVATAIAEDFGNFTTTAATHVIVRLAVAGLLGGVLGLERLHAGKAAGLRTHMLVALSSCALICIPHQAGFEHANLSRVIQGIATGIGFLGAGCIMKADNENHVKGLTTAAGIWLTAAVGIAAGLGHLSAAFVLAAFGWITLDQLVRFEKKAT